MGWQWRTVSSASVTVSSCLIPPSHSHSHYYNTCVVHFPSSYSFSIAHRLPSSSTKLNPSSHVASFRPNNNAVIVHGTTSGNSRNLEMENEPSSSSTDCVGTGTEVECLVSETDHSSSLEKDLGDHSVNINAVMGLREWAVLISPFFFWGTAMVAMKEVLPKAGPFFVSAFRLIPAGFLLVAFAASRGRPLPSGLTAWLSITLFALVDAACFQGFLAQGLERTSAGLGSVIIDSQPLTVAILAALLFGETIGIVGAVGLVFGVLGLLLLEVTLQVPALAFDENHFSLWGSGEWWMLLAAQSMAVGTVMFRWVSNYSDPIMATGWHMVIGGLPLVLISILNHDPALSGSIEHLTLSDVLALLYTSIFGSAVSYGVYFYSATKGSLTKLSSLTFLTPMFASLFGFIYLGETFLPLQLVGAITTVVAIYMVNYQEST
ncbi:EamA domain-containing protein [Cephalotus follicularis]|uniref:EamA domain-containing protein n=1 Tax=Cephalotus follicularis TaxID=3775 RepID=A0A1Q3B1P4_CEPFO|nr:EamA domain-containing protein [Cephalotus follicularis]